MSRVLDMWAGMTGTVLDFAGDTAPNGWLLCFGQSLLRADYPHLFDKIGTTYGSVDGTHFSLPDCRGRVSVGKDDRGGVAANRLTNAASGVAGATLGAAGGSEAHTLTGAQLPAHNHPVFLNDPGHTHTTTPSSPVVLGSGTSIGDTSGSYDVYSETIDSATTGLTVRDTAGGAGTANQTANNAGGGGAHPNAQPTLVFNKIIKA